MPKQTKVKKTPSGETATPKKSAYPGTTMPAAIVLEVDATDTDHRVFSVRETIPVSQGKLTLRYPRWLPGHHSPHGPIQTLAGLVITAGKKLLEWTRDPIDVYAFHVDVPKGASKLTVRFQCLTPVSGKQGRVTMTSEIIDLQWNLVTLYPAGFDTADISIAPVVKLPVDWQFASALDRIGSSQGWTRFDPVSLDTLIDSPIFAGLHFKRITLHTDAKAEVHLNLVADNTSYLETKQEQIDAHAKLINEAYALFQGRHYKRYEFLLALSDKLGGIGLEHHESSENGVEPAYFTEWDKNVWRRDLLPHEYTHSWNGKFRRPAGQCVPDFNTPLENQLLWVYEGQTQYWGQVLSARCGLWTADYAKDVLASVAAIYEFKRPGRNWRALVDTTLQPIVTDRQPLSFVTWQRTEDYYSEGQLLWLDVDTRLRELSGEKRSLDDFAATFFGTNDGRVEPLPYTFDDVVKVLSDLAPYDWAAFLRKHVHRVRPHAPLDGLARSGWKLAFQEEPTAYIKSFETARSFDDFSHSLGLTVLKDGSIGDIVWNSHAFKAGLTSGMRLPAVGNREYKKDLLQRSLKLAAKQRKPIELLVKSDDRYKTVAISYFGGPRHPVLQRIEGVPDRLGAILAPCFKPT